MVIQNMGPPVPPLHHPPVHPQEDPRVIQHRVPGQIDPEYLADQMAQLRVEPQRSAQGSYQQTGNAEPLREHTRSPYYYFGYSFFKADAAPGQKSTWKQVQRTRMNLSQEDLYQLVQKRAKKSAIQQYQAISSLKQAHVDQLINEHRRSDPRFEWTCDYIKENSKAVKGKGARRGDFETLSMDVVIVRRPVTVEPADVQTHSKPREERPLSANNFVAEDVHRPRIVEINGQWSEPAINHSQLPANMDQAQQHPQHAYQQPHFPAQGHPDAARQQHLHQSQWSGMHRQPEIPHHHGIPHSGNNPQFQPQNAGIRIIPVAPDGHPQSHDRGLGPNQVDHHADQPFMRPEVHNQTRANKTYTPRSSSLHVGPEAEWPPESSSIGDDDSELFDFEDESSATDGSDDVIDGAPERPKSWRGTLHRQNSASRQNRPEVGYRTHSRKKPTKTVSDSKLNRSKYPVGYVEVIPANSKQSSKRTVKPQPKESAVQQQPQSRPKIVQAPTKSDDLDLVYLGEKLLKGRERNDIRTRILEDREARVERREKLVEHQARMLDEKLEEARYLDRHPSLREPGLFQRRYYL